MTDHPRLPTVILWDLSPTSHSCSASSQGLTSPFKDWQLFSIHIIMAQISGSPSWALQLLFEVCFVSFSLKETLYRKITVINNEDTLTNNLEFYNHLRKGLIVPQCATGEAVWSESPSPQCLCLAVMHTAVHGSGGQGLGPLCCFCSLNSESWEQNPTDLQEKEQRTESNRKGCTHSQWSPSSHI